MKNKIPPSISLIISNVSKFINLIFSPKDTKIKSFLLSLLVSSKIYFILTILELSGNIIELILQILSNHKNLN